MRTLVAVVVAALMTLVAPNANAEDHRPCVTRKEFHGAAGNPDLRTKYQFESRWDVHGIGKRRPAFETGGIAARWYPVCGSRRMVAALFYRRGTKTVTALYIGEPGTAKPPQPPLVA